MSYVTLTDSECAFNSFEIRVDLEAMAAEVGINKMLEYYDNEDVVEWVGENCDVADVIARLRDERLGSSDLQDLLLGTLTRASRPTRGSVEDCCETVVEWAARDDSGAAHKALLSMLLDNMTADHVREVIESHEVTKSMLGSAVRGSLSAVEFAQMRKGLDVEALMKDTVEVLDNAIALVQCIGIINGLITKDPTNTIKAPMYETLTNSSARLKQFWAMVSHEYEEMRKDGRITSTEAESMSDAAHEAMLLEAEEAAALKAAAQMLDAVAQSSSDT